MIGHVIANEAIPEMERITDPASQFHRLERRILDAVPELREMGEFKGELRNSTYVASRLAKLVVSGMPVQELDQVLIDVAEMRKGEKGLENPAGFLNHKYGQLASKFSNGRYVQRE